MRFFVADQSSEELDHLSWTLSAEWTEKKTNLFFFFVRSVVSFITTRTMRATRRVFLIEKKEIKEKFANEYNPYIRSSELKPTVDILFIVHSVCCRGRRRRRLSPNKTIITIANECVWGKKNWQQNLISFPDSCDTVCVMDGRRWQFSQAVYET